MLIDVKADRLAIPQDGAAALPAHVVPDDPLVVFLVESLHGMAVAVLPVFVEEVLVSEELAAVLRRTVELAAVIPCIKDGAIRRRWCVSISF